MADFEITSPEGKKFIVSAPDGASQDQVLTYAKSEFEKMPKQPEPTLVERYSRAAVKGLPAGPFGIVGNLGAEGMKQAQEGIDRAAYGIGGKVTDMAAHVLPTERTNAAQYLIPTAQEAGFAANVGTQAIPAVLSGGPAKAIAPALESGARTVMQSALKPTLEQLRTGKAAQAITTMLEEGVNATAGGVQKLRGKIDELNGQILSAIQNSSATVDKVKAAQTLQETLAKFSKQVNPKADTAAIENAWTEFLSHPLLAGKQAILVQTAQELKQGTYKVLAGKYGEQGSASTEAQKGLARGLKEGIAEAVPEVAGLNKHESQLLNALEVSERRALMDGNKNLGGIAWLAHNPATWAAFMADKSALFKSLAARMMHSGSEQIPATAARAGATGYEAATQNRQ